MLLITNTYAQTNSNTSALPIANRPNILFIVVDDLGWNDVGFHSSWNYTTNIDRLAQKFGLQLNNYYVQSICSASRSALLAGRYPSKTGMQHEIIKPNDPYGLPLNFTLLSQDLQTKANYSTFLFGKWHLGYFNKQYTPIFRGFNTFYGFYNDMQNFNNHTVTVNTTERYDLFDNNKPVNDSMLHTYSTYIYGNKTIEAFRQYNSNSDINKNPLFIYLSLQNLHTPLQAPPNIIDSITDIDQPERKIKAAKAIVVDNVIGDIIRYINTTALWDNLLIIFSTDNGAASTDGGSNFPLRGSRGTLWEGAIRGTGFISGGYLESSQYGDISNELIHITDFYPTIMDIVNVTATDSEQLDGQSFINVIKNKNGKANRNEILLNIDSVNCNNSYHVCGAIRSGDYKLIIGNINNQVTKLNNICDGTWCANTGRSYYEESELSNLKTNKPIQCDFNAAQTQINITLDGLYTQCPFNGQPCLFNIANDPCEFFDIKADRPDILTQNIQRLQFYKSQTVTPLSILNTPINPENMYSYSNTYWTPWKNTSDMIMWNTHTPAPTTLPTSVTNAPTTNIPTTNPTNTSITTIAPTNIPTITAPTNSSSSPSKTPTIFPSKFPTILPSKTPTTSPSMNSTNPTPAPSISPTPSPTMFPTNTAETFPPSKMPSLNPTQYPSESPSKSPTYITETPSKNPSQFPSINPTVFPTMSPSNEPSMSPTFTVNPTNAPTFAPTNGPIHTHTEVATKGKKKYMTSFYLISIFAIVGCACLICIGIFYKRHRNRNRMRHRRLQDSLKGIEVITYPIPQRGGGEYSGLLD